MNATGIVSADLGAYQYRVTPDAAIAEYVDGIAILKETFTIGQQVLIVQVGTELDTGAEFGFCSIAANIKPVVAITEAIRPGAIDGSPANFMAAYIAAKAGKVTRLYDLGEVIGPYGVSDLTIKYTTGDNAGEQFNLPVDGVGRDNFIAGEIALIDRLQYYYAMIVGWWVIALALLDYYVEAQPYTGIMVSPESGSFSWQPGTKHTLISTAKTQENLKIIELRVYPTDGGVDIYSTAIDQQGSFFVNIPAPVGSPGLAVRINLTEMNSFVYKIVFGNGVEYTGAVFEENPGTIYMYFYGEDSVNIYLNPMEYTFDAWYYGHTPSVGLNAEFFDDFILANFTKVGTTEEVEITAPNDTPPTNYYRDYVARYAINRY